MLPDKLFFLLLCFHYATSEICDLSDDLSSCYKKFLSFEAIGHIHKHLDGDKNGEVDSLEAAKFVREEFSPTERATKPRSLTSQDPLVSLTDLWLMWRKNPAFSWSVKRTVQWLSDNVDLPQYEDIFIRHSVDGKALPLLAMQNMSYLNDVLLIKNPIDKRKLMLKALDTILFGPPQRPTLMTTQATLVTASCGLLFIVLMGFSHWFHYGSSSVKKHGTASDGLAGTENMLKHLQLRLEDLERLQYRLNKCESPSQPESSGLQTTDVTQTIDKLLLDLKSPRDRLPDCSRQETPSPLSQSCERKRKDTCDLTNTDLLVVEEHTEDEDADFDIARDDSAWSVTADPDWSAGSRRGPSVTDIGASVSSLGSLCELILWLQLTYELEMQHYHKRKVEAETQLNAARQDCKRMHRKRYTVLGSVRLLNTDSLDSLECRLMEAQRVLEQLQSEMQERTSRWTHIETLCGRKVRQNPGIEQICKLLASSSSSSAVHSFIRTRPSEGSMVCNRNSLTPTDLFAAPVAARTSDLADVLEPVGGHLDRPVDFVLGSRKLDSFKKSPITGSKATIPRNYSFVRPFATIWRSKAGVHTRVGSDSDKK